MKVLSKELSDLIKREPIIFLAINVVFPFSVLLLAQISREPVFRRVTALTVIALMLWANIHRIRWGRSMNAFYIVISVLNVFSFLFLSDLSFVTAMDDIWGLIETLICCTPNFN